MSGKLTTEQQETVERMWRYTASIRQHFNTQWFGLDYDSAAAIRLCEGVPKYDPSRTHWKAWARFAVTFACLDLQRRESLCGFRRPSYRHQRVPRDGRPVKHTLSHATLHDWPSMHTCDGRPECENEAASEMALLRFLSDRERTVLWDTIVLGKSLSEVASGLKCHTTRVCQIRQEAIQRIRMERSVS